MRQSKFSRRFVAVITCIVLCIGNVAGLIDGNAFSVYASEESIAYVSLYDYIDQTSIGGDLGASDKRTQDPDKLFDKDTATMWCVKKGTNEASGYVKTVTWGMTQAVTLNAYSLTTAKDYPVRDPWVWTVYGTNDEATFNGTSETEEGWVVISNVTEGNLPEDRQTESSYFVIETPGEYKYYKMTVVGNRDLGEVSGRSAIQFSEFNLFTTEDMETEEPVEYTDLHGYIDQTSIGGDLGASDKRTQDTDKLFDKDTATMWCVKKGTNEASGYVKTVTWGMTQAVTLNAYSLTTAKDYPVRDPWVWTVYGTNDEATFNGTSETEEGWVVISNVTEGNLPEDRQTESSHFTIETPVQYQYYKMTVVGNRDLGEVSGRSAIQFAELNLFTTEDMESEEPVQYTDLHSYIDQTSIGGDLGASDKRTQDTDKLFDKDTATMWCVKKGTNEASGYVKTVTWGMTQAVTLNAYSLTTAKDYPVRDPWVWTVYGTNDEATFNGTSETEEGWVVISNITEGNLPEDRQTESSYFTIEAPVQYQYYKMTVVGNRDLGEVSGRSAIQFSELNLFTTEEIKPLEPEKPEESIPYTDLYDYIDQTSIEGDLGVSVKGTNDPDKLFDKDATTMWCVRKGTNEASGYTKTVKWGMTQAITLNAYTLTTSNDQHPVRDPWVWTVYGTNDEAVFNGSNDTVDGWTVLSSVTESNLPEERKTESSYFVIETPSEYKYYKMIVVGNRDMGAAAGRSTMQFSELNLYTKEEVKDLGKNEVKDDEGVDTNKLIDITQRVRKVSIKGDAGASEKQGPNRVFDGNPKTKWCVTITQEDFVKTVQWTMMSKVTLKAYSFVTANDADGRDPRSWKLYGTNNPDGEWFELSNVPKGELPKERQTVSQGFEIKNPGQYQYYKLVITNNRSNLRNLLYQIGEIKLFAETDEYADAITHRTTTVSQLVDAGIVNANDGIVLESVKGDAGVGEKQGADKVFDGRTSTKWCVKVTEEDRVRTMQWSMKEPITLEGYAFITANDVPNRDPWAWMLYGTNDPNGTWTLLSTVLEGNFPEKRKAVSDVYLIDNPGEYQHYKLVITDNRNHLITEYYQFSEFIIFAKNDDASNKLDIIQHVKSKEIVENKQTVDIQTYTPVEKKISIGWVVLITVLLSVADAEVIVYILKHKKRKTKKQ